MHAYFFYCHNSCFFLGKLVQRLIATLSNFETRVLYIVKIPARLLFGCANNYARHAKSDDEAIYKCCTLSELTRVDLHCEYCMYFSQSVFLPFTRSYEDKLGQSGDRILSYHIKYNLRLFLIGE